MKKDVLTETMQRELVYNLFGKGRWFHLLAFVPLIILCALLWETVDPVRLSQWFVVMAVMEVALIAVSAVPLSRLAWARVQLWKWFYVSLHVVIAVGWILPMLMFRNELPLTGWIAICIILFAVAAGSLGSLSWHWPTYAMRNAILLVPLGLELVLLQDVFVLRALGSLAFVLMPLLGAISRHEYQERLRLLSAEQDKSQLTQDLQRRDSELHQVSRVLQSLRDRDAMTGLVTMERWKRQFTDRFQGATAGRAAVFFADLRYFKKINQRWGVSAGDQVIVEMASRLTNALGAEDVSHVSADEFVFFLQLEEGSEPADLAQRLVKYLSLPIQLPEGRVPVIPEPVIGVALYPEHADQIDTLVDYASLANHHCKATSSHLACALFRSEMATETKRFIDLEMGLKQAVQNQELTLLYQPQVEIRGGRIIGAEALLRWHSKNLGPVSPADFIPVAERSGLILQIGEWVLEQACETLADWQRQGLDLHLAVNVSAVQLVAGDFSATLAELIVRYCLDAQGLHVEITESAIMENPEIALGQLRKIRQLGVAVALDDFGTGYSSLSYLKNLEIDYLKLDQVFIRNIRENAKDYAITRSVVFLAKALELKIVAEGIETLEIGDLLEQMDCEYGQGWYYGKPMPAAAVKDLLRQPQASAVRR